MFLFCSKKLSKELKHVPPKDKKEYWLSQPFVFKIVLRLKRSIGASKIKTLSLFLFSYLKANDLSLPLTSFLNFFCGFVPLREIYFIFLFSSYPKNIIL